MKDITTDEFAGASLKVEWAKEHISYLDGVVRQFRHSNPYRLVVERDPQTAHDVLWVKNDPIPSAFALIIGDAVHNLSSALDHTWTVLARACGIDKKATFPVGEHWKSFEGTVKNTPVCRAFPDAQRLILDEIKPAKGEAGEIIWSCRQLDNLDKHNLIIPAWQTTAYTNLIIVGQDGMIKGAAGSIQVQGSGSMPLFRGDSEIKVHQNSKAEFDIVFGNTKVFVREPILPTLLQLTEAVSEVVKLFIKTFGR